MDVMPKEVRARLQAAPSRQREVALEMNRSGVKRREVARPSLQVGPPEAVPPKAARLDEARQEAAPLENVTAKAARLDLLQRDVAQTDGVPTEAAWPEAVWLEPAPSGVAQAEARSYSAS